MAAITICSDFVRIVIIKTTTTTIKFWEECEEELKSLLMKVKEESEKVGLKLRKLRSWNPVPSLHGK